MRILSCMMYKNRAGTERAFLTHCRLLSERGFTLLHLVHAENPFLDQLRACGEVVTDAVELRASAPEGDEQLRAFGRRFYTLVRRFEPDLAISHQFPHSHLLTKLCAGVLPHVSFVHCAFPPESVRGCDRVVLFNSRAERAFLDAGFAASQLSRLFNPAPPGAVFRPKAIHDPFAIGYLGRLSEEKGPDALLASLARLQARGVRFACFIAGTGPMEDELQRSAADLGLADAVHFLGHVSDHERFFADIDVLAIPSRSEQFPLVLFEAFAHSTPVVATRAATEILTHDVDGLLAEDSAAFASALGQLARDPGRLQRLARSGFELMARFDERRFTERLEALLEATYAAWNIRERSLLAELARYVADEAKQAGGLPVRTLSLAVSGDSPFGERRLRSHLAALFAGTPAQDAAVRLETAALDDDSDLAVVDIEYGQPAGGGLACSHAGEPGQADSTRNRKHHGS